MERAKLQEEKSSTTVVALAIPTRLAVSVDIAEIKWPLSQT